MTDDIVARLREGTSGSDIAKTDPYLNSLMQKSADEIKRLRAELNRIADLTANFDRGLLLHLGVIARAALTTEKSND